MKAGDRVWLLPDPARRELPDRKPAVVKHITDGGRVRVLYDYNLDGRCTLEATVGLARIDDRGGQELPVDRVAKRKIKP